ncbi:MAG TPA: type VI secretion system protein TssL, long form [Burkholderiales bacterium]|nr:type VI secretion system protein TssL, long form [Burkholderiales bacterium]
MSERPKGGVDPDATVMLPRDEAGASPDPDATVMIPSSRADEDATVVIPGPERDADATVMMPFGAAEPDADATVAIAPGSGLDRTAAEPDPEATIAIPTPGRKREAIPAAPAAGAQAAAADIGALGGINPLVAAANPILAVVPQIRHALRHPDPDGLRASLRERIDAFEREAHASGLGGDAVATASYALCALLDESAACTPWGAGWARNGLLAERHGDSAGGEKFFLMLETISADPAANLSLLDFFYICLALGFEGHYREAADGRQALAEKRARLLGLIRQQQSPYDGELSGHWRGVIAPARRPTGGLALWAALSGAALLLAAVYAGYSVTLGSLSDPVTRDIAQLKVPESAIPRPAAIAAATPRISEQLAGEIARGEVAVTDAAGMSTIVIRSDRFFASGSARLEAAVEPILLRVVQALDQVPGTILVTGHTDDVPIRTARFPSNWELSTERAESVLKLMAGGLRDASRLRAEGVADSVPVVPNDSAANRARNRRVEIILRSAP